MKPKILIGVLVALAFAGGVYWARRPNLPSYQNSLRASQLQPGTTKRQLIKTLGDPIGESGGWLLFEPSPTADKPIRVKLGDSGTVEFVDLGDGAVKDLRK